MKRYNIFNLLRILKEKFFSQNKRKNIKINKVEENDIREQVFHENGKKEVHELTLLETEPEIDNENVELYKRNENAHISKNVIEDNRENGLQSILSNDTVDFVVEKSNEESENIVVEKCVVDEIFQTEDACVIDINIVDVDITDIEEGIVGEEFSEKVNSTEDLIVIETNLIVDVDVIYEENTTIQDIIEHENVIEEIVSVEEHIDGGVSTEGSVNINEDVTENVIIQEFFVEKGDLLKENNQLESVLSRKEKEALYNDEKELIQHEMDIKYLSQLREIPEIDNYSKLHNRIVKEFPNIKLLCEIEINDSEYKLLCVYFRKKYLQIRRDIAKPIVDIIFSITLVQIGIRNYDGNFWDKVNDVLGIKIPQNHKTWIGGTLRKTLIAFGKPLADEKENVTNILLHCFVVQPFLIKMYDYIFQYYNLDLQRDMEGLNETDMEFLCASIKNPFGIRKQLLSKYMALSMKGNEEYCKNILYNVLQLIDTNFWNESSEEIVLPERFKIGFEEWKDTSNFYKNEKKRMEEVILSGTREKVYRKPHLKCYFEKGSFEVVLPSQMIKISEENEKTTLTWQILSFKTKRELKCNLEDGCSGYKTKELKIDVEPEEIFGEIHFLLFKDNDLIRKFSWDKYKINFFNKDGNSVSATSLGNGSYFAFTEIDTKVISDGLLAKSIINNMNFWEFHFAEGNFIQIIGENNYYVGQIPNIGLTKENLYKDIIIYTEKEIPVSVYSKLPAYVVDIPEKQFNGTAIYVNGKVERLSEKDFLDVSHARSEEKKYYFLNLEELKNIKIGFNEIIIDIPASNRNLQERFVYIPNFQYMFEDAPYVFQKRGTLSLSREIKNGIITDALCEDMQNYDFVVDNLKDGYLEFSIVFDEIAYKMAIEVPMFRYSWDKKNWMVNKPKDIWHTELQSYIYIKYPTQKISLALEKNNDMSQCIYVFQKDIDNIFVCDLTKLKSYFYDAAIIKTVKLISDKKEHDILRVITKSYLHNVTMETDYEKDYVIWKFDISGKNMYYADVFYQDECLIEKEPIVDNKIEAKMPIHSAKYVIKVYESDDEFGFDDEYDFVGQSETVALNPMELINSCMKLNKIVEIDNYTNALEVNYDYYIFICEADKKKGDKHYYIGILAEIFYGSIKDAFNIKLYIPNLNDIYSIFINFEDEYGDDCEFLYDSYKKSIHKDENTRFSKSEAYRRYEMLDTNTFIWSVQYLDNNFEFKKKVENWIKTRSIKKEKTIWKNTSYEFKDISISHLKLSVRSYTCLSKAGVLTINQLLEVYKKEDLMKVRNLGRKGYNEITQKLSERNLI